MDLLTALGKFDGKSTAPLVRLADSIRPDKKNIGLLLAFCEHDDEKIRAAATWIFKRWHDQGTVYSPETVVQFGRLLARSGDWEFHLHLLQMLSAMNLPAETARKTMPLLGTLVQGSHVLLRAWACSVMTQVADQHPRYRPEVLPALAAAEGDPAASVRARVRQLRKRYPWTRQT